MPPVPVTSPLVLAELLHDTVPCTLVFKLSCPPPVQASVLPLPPSRLLQWPKAKKKAKQCSFGPLECESNVPRSIKCMSRILDRFCIFGWDYFTHIHKEVERIWRKKLTVCAHWRAPILTSKHPFSRLVAHFGALPSQPLLWPGAIRVCHCYDNNTNYWCDIG